MARAQHAPDEWDVPTDRELQDIQDVILGYRFGDPKVKDRYLGDGCFKQTYEVGRWVVKIPHPHLGRESKDMLREFALLSDAIQQGNADYLKRIPPTYRFMGAMVQRKCERMEWDEWHEGPTYGASVNRWASRHGVADAKSENCGVLDGEWVLVDLGGHSFHHDGLEKKVGFPPSISTGEEDA